MGKAGEAYTQALGKHVPDGCVWEERAGRREQRPVAPWAWRLGPPMGAELCVLRDRQLWVLHAGLVPPRPLLCAPSPAARELCVLGQWPNLSELCALC